MSCGRGALLLSRRNNSDVICLFSLGISSLEGLAASRSLGSKLLTKIVDVVPRLTLSDIACMIGVLGVSFSAMLTSLPSFIHSPNFGSVRVNVSRSQDRRGDLTMTLLPDSIMLLKVLDRKDNVLLPVS